MKWRCIVTLYNELKGVMRQVPEAETLRRRKGHDKPKNAIGANGKNIVGGRILIEKGTIYTNEWSGHYGDQWTRIREEFRIFMQNVMQKPSNPFIWAAEYSRQL